MTKNNLYHAAWKLRATGALLLALALSTFPAAFSRVVKAQTPAQANAQTPAKATTAPATESKGGQKEGIKVHGHWTIDVRNPDGKLVTHREFENALVPTGATTLVNILGRQATTGLWRIALDLDSMGFGLAYIVEPNDDQPLNPPSSIVKKSLSVSTQSGSLVLTGDITADRDSFIHEVTTILLTCTPTTAPGSCLGEGHWMTDRLFLPVTVSAGQIIQVKVVISFS